VRATPISDLREIASHFELDGNFVSADRYGSGHINDTFLVTVARGSANVRYILQRINKHVFRNPVSLLENIRRVTEHLQSRSVGSGQCLTLVATNDGADYFLDQHQEYWRVYHFVAGARTIDTAQSREQAQEAAAIFGRFQSQLSDLPGPRLHETIPDFHNTLVRYRQFRHALERDSCGRARHCGTEIDRALSFEQGAGVLAELQAAGDLPERIVHNDAKLNNVMFDERSGAATCVIDLDTVMPGLVLYDFGDLVRSVATSAAEDETNFSRIEMRLDYFQALAEGYLGSAMEFLTEAEIGRLAIAGKIITIETGLRFLADYLSGDEYFRTHRPQHNLDRCRAQFALAVSIDAQLAAMEDIVAGFVSRVNRNGQASL